MSTDLIKCLRLTVCLSHVIRSLWAHYFDLFLDIRAYSAANQRILKALLGPIIIFDGLLTCNIVEMSLYQDYM